MPGLRLYVPSTPKSGPLDTFTCCERTCLIKMLNMGLFSCFVLLLWQSFKLLADHWPLPSAGTPSSPLLVVLT